MESLRILLLCTLSAILYGEIHDQITAHLCVEYFSVFHPQIIESQSPTMLALAWGVVATWWVGLILGIPLALIARLTRATKVTARMLIRPLLIVLVVMALSAAACGAYGYLSIVRGWAQAPEFIAAWLDRSRHAVFVADWYAHNASYAVGFIGGVWLWGWTWKRRITRGDLTNPHE